MKCLLEIVVVLNFVLFLSSIYCEGGEVFENLTDSTIYSDDPRISYVGRFASEKDSGSSYRLFGWPGTHILTRFNGTRISAELKGSSGCLTVGRGDAFLAIIDGKPIIHPNSSSHYTFVVSSDRWKSYILADELSEGQEHKLELWKVTEEAAVLSPILPWFPSPTPYAGFSSFSSDGVFALLPSSSPRGRRLEFIGDSDSAGYCSDGEPNGESVLRLTENTFNTWAVQLSQYFDAEHMIEAISGVGVQPAFGLRGMKQYWRRTLPSLPPSDSVPEWKFASWVPDAVILLIGPNDFVGKDPDLRAFIDDYKELMEDIVDAYTSITTSSGFPISPSETIPKIIHVCGGSGNGFDPCESIQTANEEFNQNRTDGFQGFYTSMNKEAWKLINFDKKFKGCSGHYNFKGHEILKEEIRTQIAYIMGW